MTQMPIEAVGDPAPLPRMRPTVRSAPTVPLIPLTQGYTTYLTEAGFPDVAESAAAFAAGQRAQAAATENRVAATTVGPAPGAMSPAPARGGARLPTIAPQRRATGG